MPPSSNRGVNVLFSEPIPHENAFVDLLSSSLPHGFSGLGFSWRRALLGRYDILHIHWPEKFFKDSRPLASAVKRALAIVLLMRIVLRRTPVVWTVHNPTPHESLKAIDQIYYRAFLARVTTRVRLSRGDAASRDVVIPHGHYRDRYEPVAQRVEPTELLSFGIIRGYKGVDDLLNAFREMKVSTDSSAKLVIRGRSDSSGIEELEEQAASIEDVDLEVGFVMERQVPELFGRASLVVLPYRKISNSGVLLLALSLNRPVLAPRTPATQSVQDEVGKDWIMLFDPPLDANDLEMALCRAESLNSDACADLSYFRWDRIGRSYAQIYTNLIAQNPNTAARRRLRVP